eukprot:Mycagemm_TRINITY_DN10342_c2_g3::TRINITY_DN10342_c2_g3_i3::g.1367::m.1367 type:complete len:113 gc:universal TRINITY_DN10342_c2_g3_i3:48-386(+)
MNFQGSSMTLRPFFCTSGTQSQASLGTARSSWQSTHWPQKHERRQSPIHPLVSLVSPTRSWVRMLWRTRTATQMPQRQAGRQWFTMVQFCLTEYENSLAPEQVPQQVKHTQQ